MKILLFADGIVGERILRCLLETYPGDLIAVVTIADNLIANLCRTAGVQTFPFTSESTAAERLANCEADLGILAWWPKIINKPLMALPKQGFINAHPSLLPHNRGKHCNFWALVEQTPIGVTLHKVSEEVDAGEIVAQRPIDSDWTDNGETLYLRAQDAMCQLFAETYPKLRQGIIKPLAQDLHQGSFHRASELNEASCIRLNYQYTARHLLNLLRARTFRGFPACWFEEAGETYEVRIQITRKSSERA